MAPEIQPMLDRLAEIRIELNDWEQQLAAFPDSKGVFDTAVGGLIDLKWYLEDKLQPAAEE